MIFNRLCFEKVIIFNKNYHFLTKIIADIGTLYLYTKKSPVFKALSHFGGENI